MDSNLYYRGEIAKIISQDPFTLCITRKTKTDDGYGGVIETETSHTVTGRLYNKRSVRELLDTSGNYTSFTTVAAEKLLCTADADIQEGDTFTVGNRLYRVILAKDYLGVCVQCELAAVKT